MKRFPSFLIACAFLPAPAAARQNVAAMHMQAHANAGRERLGDPAETHAFAICIARRMDGIEILAELPHSRRETDLVVGISRYQHSSCHPATRRLEVGGRFLRGGAAEYLLERDGGPVTDQAVFAMPDNEALERLDANIRSPIIFIQIGECAARANPAGVMALLATDVGSAAERGALNAVMPSFAGCLPAGITFRQHTLLLRAYLAEGAYRNAVADRVGRN